MFKKFAELIKVKTDFSLSEFALLVIAFYFGTQHERQGKE